MRYSLFIVCCSLALSYVQALCTFEAEGAFIPDPSSRRHFFWCNRGQPIRGECEPGLEFHPFDRFCDVPHGTPPGNNNVCFGRPDGSFVPDPTSRNHFFWCNRGQGVRGECEAGKEFHPVDLFCDRMTQVPGPPRPPVNNNPCFGRPDGSFVADPSSRNHFFWCNRGQGVRGECEAGKEFHPVDLFCDRITQGPPTGRDPCLNLPDGTFLPDPSARNRFLWCNAGQSVPGSCPDGQFFQNGGYCDFDAGPTARPTPPVPTTTQRPVAPPVPTRTQGPVQPTRPPANTTRAPPPAPTTRPGQPPAPTRQTTTAAGGRPPAPTRAPVGK